MGYTKDDELAINTIRVLAVSFAPRPSYVTSFLFPCQRGECPMLLRAILDTNPG